MVTLDRVVPVFPVADVQAAVSWYQAALEFEASFIYQDNESDASWNYAVLINDSVEIHVSKKLTNDETLTSPANCYVFVIDIEPLHRHLVQVGTDVSELEELPWGNVECRLHDPDGNRLVLSCPQGS